MKIAIVGAGYVGLVSGVCFAAKGHEVTCVDINSELVAQLNAGKAPIYERDFAELLQRALEAKTFGATTDMISALDHSDVVIIAVGTPSKNEGIDLGPVLEVARGIGQYLSNHDRYLAVVVKSTVIPGTTDSAVRSEIEKASGKQFPAFGLGMNPEFLREGEAVSDFMEPDRIVLGYEDERTLKLMEDLYASWEADKIRVNTRTAELIKYANNVLLATQISAMNEVANLADALGGIDVMDVVRAIRLDNRWNPITEKGRLFPGILSYLLPGCGFGGSCLPKDIRALRSQGLGKGLPMHLLNAVSEINDAQPLQVIEIVEREIPDLSKRTILVLGLAFKPGTDDVRESASLKIIQSLLEKKARVFAHDPVAIGNFKAALGTSEKSVTFVQDWTSSVATADLIIVATAWPEYRELAQMDLAGKVLFDARRMFEPSAITSGRYLSIGRRIAARR
ncbi:MAG TPA: UDP-glucose/GDP-mannose dehydrogenase family protein [Chthoniobacterales bacterium]|jgi:UDPglucose 6-dehydrogenase/GDP-mannose 6-dehydrogenase|nr:UDP-glucose/GDP-mannose dehydrogenase family protein [Chthoniobacterales bacterium]